MKTTEPTAFDRIGDMSSRQLLHALLANREYAGRCPNEGPML
jgi:hypothetical protein